MCGITGFYSKIDKGLVDHNLLSSANSFQHRGPDSEGYYFMDKATGLLVEVTGSIIITQIPDSNSP